MLRPFGSQTPCLLTVFAASDSLCAEPLLLKGASRSRLQASWGACTAKGARRSPRDGSRRAAIYQHKGSFGARELAAMALCTPWAQRTPAHPHQLTPFRSPHTRGSRRKGISKSALPYRRTPPSWLKTSTAEVADQVVKLAKKGLTPSQIGVILRDSHGIAQVSHVTGSKILRMLKKHGTRFSLGQPRNSPAAQPDGAASGTKIEAGRRGCGCREVRIGQSTPDAALRPPQEQPSSSSLFL